MKPVVENFRAAARLVNEWNDTLLYSGLAVGLGFALTHGGRGAIDVAAYIAFFRECTRWGDWSRRRRQIRLVGDSSAPVDAAKNSSAALFVTAAIQLLQFIPPLTLQTHYIANFFDLVGMGFAAISLGYHGSSVKNIPDLYFNKETGMWDWPRKRGGNGPTQTQKLIDGFKNIGERIAGWAPVPAPAPVGASVTASRQLKL